MENSILSEDTILKTIPINTFSVKTGQITSFASCSIVQYKGKDIILTVAHCTNEDRLIGINLEAYQGHPNIMFFKPYPIKVCRIRAEAKAKYLFRKLFKWKLKFEDIAVAKDRYQYDMLYGDIPADIVPRHNVIDSTLFNVPKRKIPITFPIEVDKCSKYQFYGLSFVGFSDGMIKCKNVEANDLRYIKNEGSEFYIFKSNLLPVDIKGCSGAPILDEKGNIVSMVVRHKKNLIWGLNLNRLNAVFDASYDEALYGKK